MNMAKRGALAGLASGILIAWLKWPSIPLYGEAWMSQFVESAAGASVITAIGYFLGRRAGRRSGV